MVYVYLAVGGVLGTLARYSVGGWIQSWAGTFLPWGTFTINMFGSFLLGFLTHATHIVTMPSDLRLLLTVGFCGAFTTFSAFSHETVTLLQEGAWVRASAYAFGSLGFGLVALFGGISLAAASLRTGG